jgi:hypothetical protein
MCDFVSADIANWYLSVEANFHIQKYDGLENIEKPSRALHVTLSSSTDTTLGHNHTKVFKKKSNRIFPGSSLPLTVVNIVFSLSVTRATHNRREN